MLDLVLSNGIVLDGTGAQGRRAQVGVKDGRVVAVGDIDESARRTIDCDGLVVCPGFVDPHTHYDAQIMWDPAATPSSLHGVTTVVGGHCGFTIAPLLASHASYVIPMLARVEGMSVDSLMAGLDFDWTSFGSWLDRLEGNLGVNAGFLCGHSTLRRLVMGEHAVGESATPDHVSTMVRLLHESLGQGALGFSSSWGRAHNDHNGDPVPSRFSNRSELLALCSALSNHEGTWIEFMPSIDRLFTDDEIELIVAMSVAAGGRSLNWNILAVRPGEEEAQSRANRLSASDIARERGGRIVALARPAPAGFRLSIATGVIYDSFPGWAEVMHAPADEKLRLLADSAVRARLVEGARALSHRSFANWAACSVNDVVNPALRSIVGRTFGEIAAERGVDPFDALCDVVIEDDLRTGIAAPAEGDDEASWAIRAEIFRDWRVCLGGSDAGAHLDMNLGFAGHTRLLGPYVRDLGYLPLEEAVHLLTDAPARIFGLRGRGRVEEGYYADLCIFDPDRIGCGTVMPVHDMPANGIRLTAPSIGMEHVFVNGVEIAHDNELTGETPGTVLRSGRDTSTVLGSG